MIRADGDALVDVLFVVRLVDPVLELEELGVGRPCQHLHLCRAYAWQTLRELPPS